MPLDPEAPTMRWLLQLGGDLCPQTLGLAARRPKNQVTESAHSPRPPEGAEAGWRARASRPHTDFSSALTPALDREAAAPSHAARGPCSQGAQLWTRSRPGCSWSPGWLGAPAQGTGCQEAVARGTFSGPLGLARGEMGEVGLESLRLGMGAQTRYWNPSWARELGGSYSPEEMAPNRALRRAPSCGLRAGACGTFTA